MSDQRAPQPWSLRKVTSYPIHISWEQYFMSLAEGDERYQRKANRIVTPPTEEDWAEYRKAQEAVEFLEGYDGFWTYEGYELEEPKATVEYEYLETVEEWLARCREIEDPKEHPIKKLMDQQLYLIKREGTGLA